MNDLQLTPETKARLQAILDRPEPSTEERATELREIVRSLFDTCEKYETALAEVYRISLGLTVQSRLSAAEPGEAIQNRIMEAVGGIDGLKHLLGQD